MKRDEEEDCKNKGKEGEKEESYRHVVESFSHVSLQEALPTAVMSEAAGYKYDPRAEEG